MALPADPAAFVAAAERGVNARDLEATAGVYAPDAFFESLTDGAHELYRGSDEIRAAWRAYLAAMDRRGFFLKKRLTAVDGDTIVNTWVGSVAARTDAQGIECWRFDDDARVCDHRMYTFLNLKPSTSPLARLRLAAAYPVTALAFLREQRRD